MWLGEPSARDRGHSFSHRARRVGHGANDRDISRQEFFDASRRNRRGHRYHQLRGIYLGADVLTHFGNRLRLDADQDNIGVLRRGPIIGPHVDTQFIGEPLGPSGVADSGYRVFRQEQLVLQQRLEQDAAYLTETQNGESFLGQVFYHVRSILSVYQSSSIHRSIAESLLDRIHRHIQPTPLLIWLEQA